MGWSWRLNLNRNDLTAKSRSEIELTRSQHLAGLVSIQPLICSELAADERAESRTLKGLFADRSFQTAGAVDL